MRALKVRPSWYAAVRLLRTQNQSHFGVLTNVLKTNT